MGQTPNFLTFYETINNEVAKDFQGEILFRGKDITALRRHERLDLKISWQTWISRRNTSAIESGHKKQAGLKYGRDLTKSVSQAGEGNHPLRGTSFPPVEGSCKVPVPVGFPGPDESFEERSDPSPKKDTNEAGLDRMSGHRG